MAKNPQKLTDHRELQPYWSFTIQPVGHYGSVVGWYFVHYVPLAPGKAEALNYLHTRSLN